MTRVKRNFVVIIIAIYCQLILINSQVNIEKDAVTELSIQKHDEEDSIKLGHFMSVTVDKPGLILGTCDIERKTEFPLIPESVDRRCTLEETSQCASGFSRVDCDTGIEFADESCRFCSCNWNFYNCAEIFDDGLPNKFSLIPQVSDIANNMIVTGLRFRYEKTVIHFQIQQGKLLSNGKLDDNLQWMEINGSREFPKNKSYDEHGNVEEKMCTTIGVNNRKFNLDDIYVPDDFVVTGVRFVKFDSSSKQNPGITMEIKGTQYNSSTYDLIGDPDLWFDAYNNLGHDSSYNRSRRKISLVSSDRSELATKNKAIKNTNRLIEFRMTDIKKDDGRNIIPYLSRDSVGSENSPLRGIGLSYKRQRGFGGYIFIKLFSHGALT